MDVRTADEDPRSDADLLAAMAEEDRSAFDVFYYRYARWLTMILLHRSKDDHTVNAVINLTFLAVWAKPLGWRGDGSVAAWLLKIALNKLQDVRRSGGRIQRVTKSVPDVEGDQGNPEPSAEECVLGRSIDYGELGPALHKLSPELLAVVCHCWLAGLTTREASKVLGVAHGTVKTRLVRARAQLRKELDDT